MASTAILRRPGATRENQDMAAVNGAAAAAATTTTSSSIATLYPLPLEQPLALESTTAFKVLVIAPLIVWWLAVGAGIVLYEGLPKGEKVYHVMIWFDKGILRPAGPLVPFAVVGLRAAIHALVHHMAHSNKPFSQRPRTPIGTLVWSCLRVYVVMAVARVVIYLTHTFLIHNRYLQYHIVSDHIFLAATMLICLHTEAICLMSDMLRGLRGDLTWQEVALTFTFVVTIFLYLFTAADMFFTAKYFHFQLESATTLVAVFLLFQLPVLTWLARKRVMVAIK